MKHLKSFNENALPEREVVFVNKRNPRLSFSVFKTPNGRITRIENCSVRFPFHVGQIFNRSIEVWACNNNFLMDGKDTCPEKKASSHLDDESIEYYKNEKEKIKRVMEQFLDDISSELDDFTTAVSGDFRINDTLDTFGGKYEYEINIKRIS